MTKIQTPRLKLTKESDDEYIDPFPLNWPILDTYAGGLLVADGVTPADVNLYDGCIVTEQTSGKQWIAKQDPSTGVFTKSWLIYPWYAEVGTPSQAVGSVPFTNTPYGFTNFWNGVNTDAATCLVGTYLVVPIAAIYELNYSVRGNNPTNNDAVLSAHISLNSDQNYMWSETLEKWNGNYTVNSCQRMMRLSAGDKLNMNIWQSYGAPMAVSIVLQVGLVCPV